MGFLDRFKNNRDDEDDEEYDDDEEDEDEDGDEDDEDEDDEDEGDDDQESGGGFLGRFRGGNKGIFGKILKKGGSDDDEDDDYEDDQDAIALPASAPPVATGQESVGVTAGSTVTPAAATGEGPGDAAPSTGAAPPPTEAAREEPAPAEMGVLAEETLEPASGAFVPEEEPPLTDIDSDVDSEEETSGSDEVDLNDLFGEKQQVDLRLKGLAEAQEDTPAEVLAEELTGLLRELEEMMSG